AYRACCRQVPTLDLSRVSDAPRRCKLLTCKSAHRAKAATISSGPRNRAEKEAISPCHSFCSLVSSGNHQYRQIRVPYNWVKQSFPIPVVKKTSLVTPVAFPDDDQHFEIDPHEAPDLPREERAHEERDPRWLRGVERRFHL